jgi:hypothetical protein
MDTHGELLLTMRAVSRGAQAGLAIVLAVVAAQVISDVGSCSWGRLWAPLVLLPWLFSLLPAKVKFYQAGVEVPVRFLDQPVTPLKGRFFLPFARIDRWHWDGDRLFVTASQDLLAGGPMPGFSLKVRRPFRDQVDGLMRVYCPNA